MGLATIEITGLSAPKMPWIDPVLEAAVPQVKASLFPPVEERLVGSSVSQEPSGAHALLAARTAVLAGRRGLGWCHRSLRASEIRHIDPATWTSPAEPA